jgi:hypothetical protein
MGTLAARRTMMRPKVWRLARVSVAAATALGIGCSQRGSPHYAVEGTGAVGLTLTLPGGVVLGVVHVSLFGTTGKNFDVDVSAAVGVRQPDGTVSMNLGTVAGLAPGRYDGTLSAVSIDGNVSCASAFVPFTVTPDTTGQVSILASCKTAAPDAGGVTIGGRFGNCARVESISASPGETAVAQSILLEGTISAPNPAAVKFGWSLFGNGDGYFMPPSGTGLHPSTTFTCTAPGAVTIVLTAGNGGDPPPLKAPPCSDVNSKSVVVVCEPPPADGGGGPAACVTDASVSVTPGVGPIGTVFALQASAKTRTPSALTYFWGVSPQGAGAFSASPPPGTPPAEAFEGPGREFFVCNETGLVTITSVQTDPTVPVGIAGCHNLGVSDAQIECLTSSPPPPPGCDGGSGPSYCAPNNGGCPCTPTETLFLVNRDPSCYDCLVGSGCLDDALFASDVNHECGDLPASAQTATGDAPAIACLNTIACILGASCADATGASPCYCGTAAGAQCLVPGAANGPCMAEETDGLATSDPKQVDATFLSTSLPAGMANTIFTCAATNDCTGCLP